MDWRNTLFICLAVVICFSSMAWCVVNEPKPVKSEYRSCVDGYIASNMDSWTRIHEKCMELVE